MTSSSSVPPPAPPHAVNQQPAPSPHASNPTAVAQGDSMSDSVSSMAELKEKAPEIYKAMMQGIAMNICFAIERQQSRLKKMQEEFRRQAEEG